MAEKAKGNLMINWSTEVGLIAFGNSGGLAIQCKRIYDMMGAKKILLIDSSTFSPNKDFNPEMYPKEKTMIVRGFPKNYHVVEFLKDIKYVFTVENPYNFYLVKLAHELGIKVICQTNYEFCENVSSPWLPVPDLFLMPSYWYLEEMKARFNAHYLPPPIDPNEFKKAREINKNRRGKKRFLHVVGTLAFKDRNGTLDLLKAVTLSKRDYELVIHSQHALPSEYRISDSRLIYSIGNLKTNAELYEDYDAVISPRRYGGLSLTTNEAMMSALPVITTNISPNNRWLPGGWLVTSFVKDSFQARDKILCSSISHQELADRIDLLTKSDLTLDKRNAYFIARENFSPDILKEKYENLCQLM